MYWVRKIIIFYWNKSKISPPIYDYFLEMDLRKFDVFPKLDNEFRMGTTYGGILTIFSIIMAVFLSFTEVKTYLNPTTRQRLAVDTRRPTGKDGVIIDKDEQPKLDILINVTFPSVPCYVMHIDVIDYFSQLSLPLENINHKFTRLTKDGKEISEFDQSKLLDSTPVKCGSCYKANTSKICCNTCKELFEEYNNQYRHPPRLYKADQCKEVYERLTKMDGEGCSIYAEFTTPRVASEFHISPGYSWNTEGWHIHDIKLFNKTYESVNLTHTIHSMKFSKKEGTYPLDGKTIVHEKNESLGVIYLSNILEDNFTSYSYQIYSPTAIRPGVTFRYDVSPITAVEYIDKEPFMHLLTRLLTVLGAVLGLFRLINTLMFSAQKSNAKKQEIK